MNTARPYTITLPEEVPSDFRNHDLDGDGVISTADMTVALQRLSVTLNLRLTDDQVSDITAALLHNEDAQLMTHTHWDGLLKRWAERTARTASVEEPETRRSPLSRLGTWLRMYRLEIVWFALHFLLQLAFFGVGVCKYMAKIRAKGREFAPLNMVGISLAMNLQASCGIMLFFPAYRWCMSRLRSTFLAKFLPLDSSILFHIVLGWTVGVCAVAHSTCFLVQYYEVSIQPNATYTFLQDIGEFNTGITGWILVATLITISFFSLPFIKNTMWYDVFYWTHKLQFVFWVTLILHAKDDFWKVFILPFAIYILEKGRKYVDAFRWGRVTRIVEVNLLPNKMSQLVIKRPEGFHYKPGDYIFLKAPHLGWTSWHAFTISSAPEQKDILWLHIKASGNWTRHLRRHYENSSDKWDDISLCIEDDDDEAQLNDTRFDQFHNESDEIVQSIGNLNTVALLDGPYSASTASFFDTEHAVLISAGIGVAPFVSVLGSVVRRRLASQAGQTHGKGRGPLGKLQRLDFFWIVREHSSVQWFADLLHDAQQQHHELADDCPFIMDFHIYVTSVPQQKELEVLQMGLKMHHELHGVDALTGLRTETKCGRPKWPAVFRDLSAQSRHGSVHVFYCGPQGLEKELRWFSAQHRFHFSWENF
ncbi:NADPH oxidase 5 [Hypsibius exemplaris]|uniref:NADPH oxidase 5 n=1 Tax=Hypsibius exemplaris TaxID=2072580 RepID=A0A1W0X763_HYPEX|nr:NADPH oxidase 5 [Hypsibius exemplaris]